MKDVKYKIVNMRWVFVLIVALWGCDYDPPGSLYNPDEGSNPAPEISSIEPEVSLAGVGEIVITGSNFSSVIHENMVYFGEKSAHIFEASPTQLRVQPPNLTGESLHVRVAVAGAIAFSNSIEYSLLPAVQELRIFRDHENPYAVAVDSDNNLYVGIHNANTGRTGGIYKITPASEISTYGTANHLRDYTSLRFGPDGYLYSAQGRIRLISRIPPGGGEEENWLTTLPANVRIVSIDFDEYGYLWAVGNNENIYRIQTSDRSFTPYPFDADVQSVRYFDGHLYLSGTEDNNTWNVWRIPINSDGVSGTPEIYFPFSEEYNSDNAAALGITIAADGTLYIGTDGPDGIITVHPDKSWTPLHPGLLNPKGLVLHWGADSHIYMTREIGADSNRNILKINTLKEGAPYFN